jgi:hypothetical protein
MPDDIIRNDPSVYSVRPGIVNPIINRVSWGAIWSGVMAALGMEALFAVFGLFVGFGMYSPGAANPWSGVSSWSLVWYLITAAWSMFFGAWCAATLSGELVANVRVLHGIATWGLSTVATIAVVVLGSWSVLREGINMLGGVTAPAVQVTTIQGTVSDLSGIALRIWIGVLLGLITAIIGGIVGQPRNVVISATEVPVGTRRAA